MPQEAMDGRSGLGNFFAALGKEVTRPGGRNKRPPRTPKRSFTGPVNPATPLAEKRLYPNYVLPFMDEIAAAYGA